MLARTLFRSLAKRSGLANNKQTRSFVYLFNRSSANALNRSVSKRSNLSLCCNVKTAVFTPKTIQKRYLSNEDALKDAGWNEESSKVMQKMDELFIWIEKYYTHPENDVQHKNLFDRIHELMESSEYHTVQDFCHYALVGTLLAAVTESEHARTHTLPLMQSIMREVPAKLDFLNECVALWHILSKANDNKNKPGKSFTEQLNDLDSVEEVDPFTKAKLFQGFYYFTGDLGMIMRMMHNFNLALKESAVPEAVEEDLIHIGLVVSSLALAHSMAVPIFVKLLEDDQLDKRLLDTIRMSVQRTLNHSIEP